MHAYVAFANGSTISAGVKRLYGCQVVLDLGRRPEARFQGMLGGEFLRDEEVRGVKTPAVLSRSLCMSTCVVGGRQRLL